MRNSTILKSKSRGNSFTLPSRGMVPWNETLIPLASMLYVKYGFCYGISGEVIGRGLWWLRTGEAVK